MIEDETEFCGEELLHSVLQCKVRPCGCSHTPETSCEVVFWGFSSSLFAQDVGRAHYRLDMSLVVCL